MTWGHGLHLNLSHSGGEEAAGDLPLHLPLALLALGLLAASAVDGASEAGLTPRRPVHQRVVHEGLQQRQQSLPAAPHDVQNLGAEACELSLDANVASHARTCWQEGRGEVEEEAAHLLAGEPEDAFHPGHTQGRFDVLRHPKRHFLGNSKAFTLKTNHDIFVLSPKNI